MKRLYMFIFKHEFHSRRKTDPIGGSQRRIAVQCWDNTVKMMTVNVMYCKEDGEYGKWLALCKSRRELWELIRRNDE